MKIILFSFPKVQLSKIPHNNNGSNVAILVRHNIKLEMRFMVKKRMQTVFG